VRWTSWASQGTIDKFAESLDQGSSDSESIAAPAVPPAERTARSTAARSSADIGTASRRISSPAPASIGAATGSARADSTQPMPSSTSALSLSGLTGPPRLRLCTQFSQALATSICGSGLPSSTSIHRAKDLLPGIPWA
jgi:hypothetical protein